MMNFGRMLGKLSRLDVLINNAAQVSFTTLIYQSLACISILINNAVQTLTRPEAWTVKMYSLEADAARQLEDRPGGASAIELSKYYHAISATTCFHGCEPRLKKLCLQVHRRTWEWQPLGIRAVALTRRWQGSGSTKTQSRSRSCRSRRLRRAPRALPLPCVARTAG